MLTTASFQHALLNENRRKKLDLRSELIVEFSGKKDKFSNLQNYSNLEIIKIRYYYYQNGHDGENDPADNALNWPESKLQEKLHSDIKLEKVDYFKFKEIIGRALLNEFSLSQMEEFNQEPKDVALSSTNEHFEKAKSRYTQMTLNELSQLAGQLEEQSKQDALQVEEIQALVESINKPAYVFSFAFPPLYSVPTPEIRNKIDDELNKAQAKYQQSTSQALEVGLTLDARVKNSSKLLSEISNENENDKKRALATLTGKERKEFVEYLHHQAGVLEKECLEHKKNLSTLKHSFGRFFGKQKSQIEMAKVNLARTQDDLKKLQQVQSTLAEMKDAKVQKRGEVEAEKRKGALGFTRVKTTPSTAAREDKAPKPTSSAKSPKT